MFTRIPARAGSVRISPDQRQWLSARQKGRIMRRINRRFDVYTSRIADFLLFRWVSPNGCCDPSLSTIAEGSGVSLTTVKDRLPKLQAAGILRIINRGIAGARRFVQWTNAYLFEVDPDPTDSLPPCEAAARPPNTMKEKERVKREAQPSASRSAPQVPPATHPTDLLARARQRMAALWANGRPAPPMRQAIPPLR